MGLTFVADYAISEVPHYGTESGITPARNPERKQERSLTMYIWLKNGAEEQLAALKECLSLYSLRDVQVDLAFQQRKLVSAVEVNRMVNDPKTAAKLAAFLKAGGSLADFEPMKEAEHTPEAPQTLSPF